MKSTRTIPVLRIFDEAKAREFYLDWLGFTLDWEHRFGENFPLYAEVSGYGVALHLTGHHGDCCPGSKVFIECAEGLEAFQKTLLAKDYRYFKPGLEQAFWGALTMSVTDPFGNTLLFSEAVDG